jgi:hypothetical protein
VSNPGVLFCGDAVERDDLEGSEHGFPEAARLRAASGVWTFEGRYSS